MFMKGNDAKDADESEVVKVVVVGCGVKEVSWQQNEKNLLVHEMSGLVIKVA